MVQASAAARSASWIEVPPKPSGRLTRAMPRVEYLAKIPIDLKDLITETVPIVRREPANHGTALKRELEHDLPAAARDPVAAQLAVLDLRVGGNQPRVHVCDRPRGPLAQPCRTDEA